MRVWSKLERAVARVVLGVHWRWLSKPEVPDAPTPTAAPEPCCRVCFRPESQGCVYRSGLLAGTRLPGGVSHAALREARS